MSTTAIPTSGFSAKESADLDALFANPRRVEVTSSDRSWRQALLGSLILAAGLSFGAEPARADQAAPAPDAPRTALAALPGALPLPADALAADDAPVFPTGAGALKRLIAKNGFMEVAATAQTVKPKVYPIYFRAGVDTQDTRDRLLELALSTRMVEPEGGKGFSEVIDDLMAQVAGPKANTPASYSYSTEDKNTTGCVLLLSESHASNVRALARDTGMSLATALDFSLLHEEAHCAQGGESVAAMAEIQRNGSVSSARAASGLLTSRMSALIASGRAADAIKPEFAFGRDQKLSAERYADGFATLALLAQNRLSPDVLDGLIDWRTNLSDHATGPFLAYLRDQVQKDPNALPAMASTGPTGFDAKAIATFLQPAWRAFEAREDAARDAARIEVQSTRLRDAILGRPADTSRHGHGETSHAAGMKPKS